jgi:hypothetical protein
MTGCECQSPGFCQRHGIHKGPAWFKLCQKSEKHWQAWEAGHGVGQRRGAGKPLQPTRRRGPGTELSKMLKRFGIEYVPGCKCADHARQMDLWGPDGCERQIQTIVGWLRKESEKRGLPFVEFAAKHLVQRAINRARRAQETADGHSY